MNTDLLFSLSGTVALAGWAALGVSLFVPKVSHIGRLIARVAVPLVLSALYAALIAGFFAGAEGGFDSLQAVAALFRTPELLLAGWIHYLAFDLLVGTAIVADGREAGISPFVLLPVLALTFLFGPAGFLVYMALRLPMLARMRSTA